MLMDLIIDWIYIHTINKKSNMLFWGPQGIVAGTSGLILFLGKLRN